MHNICKYIFTFSAHLIHLYSIPNSFTCVRLFSKQTYVPSELQLDRRVAYLMINLPFK
jgi:hypothetical protein